MNTKIKYGLSAAVLALIAIGAPAPDILDQFLDEKEGNHTTAYRDGSGIWTICRGATMVDGKPVFPGMKLSKEKCDQVNAIERDKALAWVERNIKVPLTEPQKARRFAPITLAPVSVSRRRFISGLMPVIVKVPVSRFAGGLRTVGVIAAHVQITATDRLFVVTRKAH